VKTLTLYKRIIEELGLKQLDVYRIRDDKGVLKDIVRLFDPSTYRVITIDLGKIREALQPGEFLEAIVNASNNAGIRLPERVVSRLREKFAQSKSAGRVEEPVTEES